MGCRDVILRQQGRRKLIPPLILGKSSCISFLFQSLTFGTYELVLRAWFRWSVYAVCH